jgi:hypothetical protein
VSAAGRADVTIREGATSVRMILLPPATYIGQRGLLEGPTRL